MIYAYTVDVYIPEILLTLNLYYFFMYIKFGFIWKKEGSSEPNDPPLLRARSLETPKTSNNSRTEHDTDMKLTPIDFSRRVAEAFKSLGTYFLIINVVQ